MSMPKEIALVAALWGVPFVLGIALVSVAATRQGRTPGGPERIDIRGIENTFRLSPRLFSGGDPHGTEALSALKELGVRTIISVDGAAPDVEAARALGLRYVHLPIGYDGVPREQAVKLARAVETLPGPVYVHCHHGKHRGPAAAAVCGIATEGWDRERALSWLGDAGTSPDYAGLFESVEGFEPPSAEELAAVGPGDLPERAEVPALVEAMVRVDERWELLGEIAAAGFGAPPDHPDLDPPHEALMLAELYRELARTGGEAGGRGEAFLDALREAEGRAMRLRDLLRDPGADREALGAAFEAAGNDCKACHARHRN